MQLIRTFLYKIIITNKKFSKTEVSVCGMNYFIPNMSLDAKNSKGKMMSYKIMPYR